jgi:hypothetical protein
MSRKKCTVFSDVIPCSSERRRFGGKYRLNFPTASFGFLLGLIFEPEVGCYDFVRNIGLYPNYTALQPYFILPSPILGGVHMLPFLCIVKSVSDL